ncbi:MAG: hypothetical protein ABSF86_23320 [Steroidobacteraceae bacterium]
MGDVAPVFSTDVPDELSVAVAEYWTAPFPSSLGAVKATSNFCPGCAVAFTPVGEAGAGFGGSTVSPHVTLAAGDDSADLEFDVETECTVTL